MNTLMRLDGVELWQLAGWTMLHFLWIGTAIGIAALACRLVVGRAPAAVRYAVALGCLWMLAGTPGGVAAWLVVHGFANSVHLDAPLSLRNGDGELPGAPVAPTNLPLGISTDRVPEQIAASSTDELAANLAGSAMPAISVAASNGQMLRQLSRLLGPCVRFLPWLWLVGMPLTFALLTTGVVGAERLRRSSRIISDGPIAEACERLAKAMRITRRVAVAVCDRVAAPVLVGIVRPIILLPPAALTGWSPDDIEMVLLHELAHVRRWDNLVNLAQRLIESLLFYHPAVWLVSSWVRREREACCDVVVVGRTERPHAYAELLVALAAQMPRSVLFYPAASSAMAAGPLRGRIRRILQLEDDPMLVSGKPFLVVVGSVVVAVTLVVLYLPARGQANESALHDKQELTADGSEEKLASGSDNAATNLEVSTMENPKFAEVPLVVGATRFSDGDKITIREVRGTAATFEPGNIYWIKGTYALRSHDRAMLAANTTAKDAAHRTSPSLSVQSTNVNRGEGTFTLFLPMLYRGWPHVSFYPADHGESFGGVYLGTGDSVLKHWWGSIEVVDSMATNAAESMETQQSDEDTRRVAKKVDDNPTATADARPSRLRLQVKRTEGKSDKFPSLEDQKLADVAYRRLRLELEPIGEADLRRVKALGFEGGLKVTHGTDFGIWENDILVGLHIWPTTNVEDVAEVLNRGDLAELNPLKFYVIRSANRPDSEQGDGDIVFTGRISVNLDGQEKKDSRRISSREPAFRDAAPTGDSTYSNPTPAKPQAAVGPVPSVASVAPEVPRVVVAAPVLTAPAVYQSSPTNAYTTRTDVGPRAEQMLAQRIERATKRRDEAKKDLDDAKKQLLEADKGGDKYSVLAAKPEYDAAIQEYMDAKRALNDLKRELAERGDEPQIDRSGEEPRRLPGPPTQQPPGASAVPPPTPTQIMRSPAAMGGSESWLLEQLTADEKISQLSARLLAAQARLSMLPAESRDGAPAEQLQTQIAEMEKTLAALVAQKKAQLFDQQSQSLDNAANQAASALAATQMEFMRVTLQKDGAIEKQDQAKDPESQAKAKQEFETAQKRYEEAKRAVEERKRAVEAIKRQFEELQRQREQVKPGANTVGDDRFHVIVLFSSSSKPTQPLEAGMDWMKKHPDMFLVEPVDMDTQPEEAHELTKKHHIKQGPAFIIFRNGRETARREGVSDPFELAGVVQDLAGDSAQNQPAGLNNDRPDVGRRTLEQLHRQLEVADRQLEATKRQLEALVRQKEALAHQASELAQKLQQQSAQPEQSLQEQHP